MPNAANGIDPIIAFDATERPLDQALRHQKLGSEAVRENFGLRRLKIHTKSGRAVRKVRQFVEETEDPTSLAVGTV